MFSFSPTLLIKKKKKDPLSWTVADVGSWLQHLHLGEHRIKFIENFIAGSELLELAEEDLISLGVTAIGHRKKITRAIKALNDRILNGSANGSVDDDDRRSDSGSEYSESSDTRSHDSNQARSLSLLLLLLLLLFT